MNQRIEIKKNGYTLLELLLGVAIFSIVAGVGAIAFNAALQAQRSLTAEKNLSESTRFAIEYMSRQIRLAQQEKTGGCLPIGHTYAPNSSTMSSIGFNNSDDKCISFLLNSNKIQMQIGAGDRIDLTSDASVIISNLSFTVVGGLPTDNLQPLVTISMMAQGVAGGIPTGAVVPIQTTVSERAIDVPQS